VTCYGLDDRDLNAGRDVHFRRQILVSHGGEYEDDSVLGYCALLSRTASPTFHGY
jgi:hypothetical protein